MKPHLAGLVACAVLLSAASASGEASSGDVDRPRATWRVLPASYLKQAKPKGRSSQIRWTFRDTDIQKLLSRLKRFGVEAPVEVTGVVTVRLSITAPWRSLLRPSAYEIEGDLSSDSLKIAGFELRKLAMHLTYTDGALQLTKMSFSVPGKDGRDGTVSGTARVQVRPSGNIAAQLSIARIPLATFFDTVPELAGRAVGTADGQFSGQAPVERARNAAAWQAQGRLTLSGVQAFGLPAAQATTDFRLKDGRAAVTNLSARLERATVTGAGELTLAAPFAFTARVRAAVPDLAWLKQFGAGANLPPVAGSFILTADASGALQPRQAAVRGALSGRNLKFDDVAIDRLQIPYQGTLDRIRLNDIRIDLFGGQIMANLSLPTRRESNVGVGLRVRNVDFGGLASAALRQKRPWRGRASGTAQLQAPWTRLQEPAAWTGQGQMSFGRSSLSGIDVARGAAAVRIDKGRLIVNQLTIESPLAQVTGSAQLNLTTPFGFGAALRMANVDFAQLNRLPDELRPPVAVGGRAGVSANVQGALAPISFTARGGAATRSLTADGVVIDTLNLTYNAQASGDLREPANWRAEIDADLAGARLDRMTWRRGKLTAGLAEGTVTLSRLAAQEGAMGVEGSATLGLTTPHEFALKLTAKNFDLSIANRLPSALRPPAQIAGVVSASADIRGRLDPFRVEGGGKLSARQIRADRASIDSLGFDFAADGDSLTLSRLAATAYRGRVDGKIRVPLTQAAAGQVDLRWQRLNVGGLLTDLSGLLGRRAQASDQDGHRDSGKPSPLFEALAESRFQGWTWGSVAVQTPAGKLLDPASWTGEVDFSLAAASILGWSAQQAFVKGRLADGQAELTRLAFDIGKARLRGTASLKLTQPYDFRSQLSLEHLRLADFNNLPDAIRPPVKLAGEVTVSAEARGTLEPPEVTGQGSLTADQVEVGDGRIDRLAIDFSAEKKTLELKRFHAELYQGQVDGTASIALEDDAQGKVAFTWRNVNIGEMATDVAYLPVPLRGTISGQLDLGVPGGKLADATAWTAQARFETSPLLAESANLGQLSGRVSYERRTLDYNVHGSLLRGTMELAGRWQPQPPANAVALNEGHFQIAGARLDALTPLVRSRGAFDSLLGQFSVNVRYKHDESTGLPSGSGDLAIDDIRLNGVALLGDVRGVVRVAADRMEIANIQGAFAGGAVTASAIIFFNPARRGSFRASVDGADIAQIVATWPKLASRLAGTLDAQVQGFVGGRRPVQVSGVAAVRRGKAAGVEYDAARLPFTASFDPLSGRGLLQTRGASARVARGRLLGDFELALANGLDLKGRGKFSGLDLRTLLHQSAAASRLASGKIDGDYTVAGRNVRSAADLTGTVNADLTDTQALALPVLQRTLPFLTGGVSGSTNFDQGTLRANLSRSVIRIERFSLASGSVQIYARGNVTLAGRLDLEVTANTGQLNARWRAVSLLAARIALFAAPPVGLLLEATQFLSNQVINLEVTGTVRSPTIRIRPLQFLGQEAAQFFLWQALP